MPYDGMHREADKKCAVVRNVRTAKGNGVDSRDMWGTSCLGSCSREGRKEGHQVRTAAKRLASVGSLGNLDVVIVSTE